MTRTKQRNPLRDTKKLLLAKHARDRRTVQRKLQKTIGATGQPITEEMITSALSERTVSQIDDMTRAEIDNYQPKKIYGVKKSIFSELTQLPYSALKKHVQWLSPTEQDTKSNQTLTHELIKFSSYVKLDEVEQGARESMMLDIQDAIHSKFPLASLSQFGSYPAGLSIFLSDIDVSVDDVFSSSRSADIDSANQEQSETLSGIKRKSNSNSNSKLPLSGSSFPVNKKIKFDDSTAAEKAVEVSEEVTWMIDSKPSQPTPDTNQRQKDVAPVLGQRKYVESSKGHQRRVLPIDDCFDDDFSDEDSTAGSNSSDSSYVFENSDDNESGDSFPQRRSRRMSKRSESTAALSTNDAENDWQPGVQSDEESAREDSAYRNRFAKSSSSASLEKLPQDIDVPFWDGISSNSSNAALVAHGGSDGVLDDALAQGLYRGDCGVRDREEMAPAERVTKRNKVDMLTKLFKVIKTMLWVRKVELRKHARVPIINLVHKNGVECDISLDMSQQTTSKAVRRLQERCGPALFILSSFLKVFLAQLSLDMPFTGGLGSYKLYVLIAKHIERHPEYVTDKQAPQLGELLLSFLNHYSAKQNLNLTTEVTVCGIEPANFGGTMKIDDIRRAFQKAHIILSQPKASVATNGSGGHSFLKGSLSSSILATVLNTSHLCAERTESRRLCKKYPQRSEEEREAVAQKLLVEFNRKLQVQAQHGRKASTVGSSMGTTLEEVKRSNPSLYARLRSFPTMDSAMSHLSNSADTYKGRDAIDLQMQINDALTGSTVVPVPEIATITLTTDENQQKVTKAVQFEPVSDGLSVAAISDLIADIPVLALQMREEKDNPFFELGSLAGKAVIKGKTPLDPTAVISTAKVFQKLPKSIQAELGQFPCLAVARYYVGKSATELAEVFERESIAIAKVNSLVDSGDLAASYGPHHAQFLHQCNLAGVLVMPPEEAKKLQGKDKYFLRESMRVRVEVNKLKESIGVCLEEQDSQKEPSTNKCEELANRKGKRAKASFTFDPTSEFGVAILNGQVALPPGMIVSKEHRHLLPQLGSFPTLNMKKKFDNMTVQGLQSYQRSKSKLPGKYRRKMSKCTLSESKIRDLVVEGVIEPPEWFELTNEIKKAKEDALDTADIIRRYISERVRESSSKSTSNAHERNTALSVSPSQQDNDIPAEQQQKQEEPIPAPALSNFHTRKGGTSDEDVETSPEKKRRLATTSTDQPQMGRSSSNAILEIKQDNTKMQNNNSVVAGVPITIVDLTSEPEQSSEQEVQPQTQQLPSTPQQPEREIMLPYVQDEVSLSKPIMGRRSLGRRTPSVATE